MACTQESSAAMQMEVSCSSCRCTCARRRLRFPACLCPIETDLSTRLVAC